MLKISIEELWRRLKELEGQEFETKHGLPFKYTIIGNMFYSSRTDYNLAKSNFEKALELVPFEGPGIIADLRGTTYVWAVLHDSRVRQNDW